MQYTSGARLKELAHGPDEPAHVGSALMIHDYLASGFRGMPQQYAEMYYAHYPKLAIGIWPPLMYAIAALWMFPFGVSRLSLLLLSATLISILASLLFVFVRRMYGTLLGVTAGILFLLLHSSQEKIDQFMLDMAIALASFLAMMLMVWYFRTERFLAAFFLGLTIAAAMLVKGNGMALILMVGMMVLLANRLDLLKKKGLYVSAMLVVLIGLPWQFLTLKLLARQQNVVPFSVGTALRNALGYTRILSTEFTLPILALIVAGLAMALWTSRTKGTREELALPAVACLFLATVLFHCIVPVVGSLDSRYMTAALPPGIVLFLAGCWHLARVGLRKGASPAIRMAVLVSCAVISAAWLGAFHLPNMESLGFSQAASLAIASDGPCCTMLICSDSQGEGAFISEIALRDRKVTRVVLRSTKLISESPWNGQTFKMLFTGHEELAKALDANAVDVVVVDRTEAESKEARAMLLDALQSEADKWKVTTLRGEFARVLDVYVRKDSSGLHRGAIRVPMPFTLDHFIELPAH